MDDGSQSRAKQAGAVWHCIAMLTRFALVALPFIG